jgi:D-amino peptidase
MKILIMTDIEGVAGVLDADNWIYPHSKYKDTAISLLTSEVNAAIEGFFQAGATEIHVVDGHGSGGINVELLDARVFLRRRASLYEIDSTFDVLAYVGQHAKSGTEYGHLCHTQSFRVLDYTLNGLSIGEFGQYMFSVAEFGIIPIFASGDYAFTKEAKDLVPGIETVYVKRGTTPGKGDECTEKQYGLRNSGAIHFHPTKARAMIEEGAKNALKRFIKEPESFKPTKLKPPYKGIYQYRPTEDKEGYKTYAEHKSSVAKMMYGEYKLIT